MSGHAFVFVPLDDILIACRATATFPRIPIPVTCVDRFAQCPEVIPMVNMMTEDCAQALLSGWVSHFSVPSTIVWDEGLLMEVGSIIFLAQTNTGPKLTTRIQTAW